MQVIKTTEQMREYIKQQHNETIGFVPTMGYLHEGHISLLKEASKVSKIVVTSIFINPLQFNNPDDLKNYPQNLDRDTAICGKAGVDVVFIPTVEEIYGNSYPPEISISANQLSQHLCGATRPGHFDGVCMVVTKLLNIVTPTQIFLGKKDIQQLRIIETMIDNFSLPTKVIACDTIRTPQGLALSSRNSRLNSEEQRQALIIPKILQHIASLIDNGNINAEKLIAAGKCLIEDINNNLQLDYLEIVDYNNLQPVGAIHGKVIIAIAMFIGKTRLIDNIIFNPRKSS